MSRLDTGEELFSHERETQISNRLTEVRYHFRFNVLTFPVPGLYLFTLLIDGNWVAQRRLLVQTQEEQG